jgi:hypothetical protein
LLVEAAGVEPSPLACSLGLYKIEHQIVYVYLRASGQADQLLKGPDHPVMGVFPPA